jgi:hypothetical protein
VRKVLRVAAAVLVLVLMLLPLVGEAAAAAGPVSPPPRPVTRPYIYPGLLDPKSSIWRYGGLVEQGSVLAKHEQAFLAKAEKLGLRLAKLAKEPIARILVVLPPDAPKSLLASVERTLPRTIAVLPTHMYTVVVGMATPETVKKLAMVPGVEAILPDVRTDAMIHMPPRGSHGEPVDPDAVKEKPQPTQAVAQGLGYHYTVNLTRAIDVWTKYGINGTGATIAIVDTGVDYASPGLGEGAIARDRYGLPMVLDLSGGLVFFPAIAQYIGDDTIRVNFTGKYTYIPLLPYSWYVSDGTAFEYYNGNFVFYNVSGDYKIPHALAEALENGAAPIRFGVAFQTVETPAGLVVASAPAIIADSNADGYYDVIYLDLSTAAHYLNQTGLQVAGAPSSPDYSFADEKPVTYGSEIAARDLNGDGYYDLSFGTLAGYEYDAYGYILAALLGALDATFQGAEPGYLYFLPTLTSWEAWDWENIGGFWPGLDVWSGTYAALEYDFHSHGTFCATTAAGRPVPAYTGYGEGGLPVSLVSGQAPGAKVAAANMFFTGDALVSIYFFSGFDLETEYAGLIDVGKAVVPVPFASKDAMYAILLGSGLGYEWSWTYTGEHQADITSNSYGISAWALYPGFASGKDPLSAVFDYTEAVSGTLHFVAMGNGGPGYGTATVPGASTLSVSVGAGTEFTYRPLYGYLPGGNREVVSWSDRGPTAAGVAKPDVVAIGSFAFAVGRTWDSAVYGELNGNPFYTVDLFGGTSQATPMTAGVAALVVSAYKQAHGGQRMPAWLLKTVLMNSAHDMGFDTMTQGAGFVDAYAAVTRVLSGGTVVYNLMFPREYASIVAGTDTETFTYGKEMPRPFKWYEPKVVITTGKLRRGTAVLRIQGSGTYTVKAVEPRKVYEKEMTVNIPIGQLGSIAIYPVAVFDVADLAKYDMVRIYAYYPYRYFDDGGRYYNTTHSIFYNGLELWLWIDLNRDGAVQFNETARIQYDLRGANAFTLDVGYLQRQVDEIVKLVSHYLGVDAADAPMKLLLVYRVWFNGWSGSSETLPLRIIVQGYQFKPSRMVRAFPGRLRVYRGYASIRVTASAPAQPGVYHAYVVIEGGSDNARILVPVSVVAARPVYAGRTVLKGIYYKFIDGYSTYQTLRLRGAFDYTWHYESGDWRIIPLYVNKYMTRFLKALVVEIRWPNATDPSYTSNLDAAVFGPHNFYMAVATEGKNVTRYTWEYPVEVQHVTGYLLGGELSLDFTQYWDSPAPGVTRFMVPVDSGGVYYLVVRNIQFSGEKPYDDFEVRIYGIAGFTPYRIFTRAGGTSYAFLMLRGMVPQVFKDISVEYTNESFHGDRRGHITGYFDNATFVKIEKVFEKSYASRFYGYYRARLKITLDSDVPVGRLETLYPVLNVTTPVPILSIGILGSGSKEPVFVWNSFPLMLQLSVYKPLR